MSGSLQAIKWVSQGRWPSMSVYLDYSSVYSYSGNHTLLSRCLTCTLAELLPEWWCCHIINCPAVENSQKCIGITFRFAIIMISVHPCNFQCSIQESMWQLHWACALCAVSTVSTEHREMKGGPVTIYERCWWSGACRSCMGFINQRLAHSLRSHKNIMEGKCWCQYLVCLGLIYSASVSPMLSSGFKVPLVYLVFCVYQSISLSASYLSVCLYSYIFQYKLRCSVLATSLLHGSSGVHCTSTAVPWTLVEWFGLTVYTLVDFSLCVRTSWSMQEQPSEDEIASTLTRTWMLSTRDRTKPGNRSLGANRVKPQHAALSRAVADAPDMAVADTQHTRLNNAALLELPARRAIMMHSSEHWGTRVHQQTILGQWLYNSRTSQWSSWSTLEVTTRKSSVISGWEKAEMPRCTHTHTLLVKGSDSDNCHATSTRGDLCR